MSELPPRELSAVRIPQPIRGAAVWGTSSIKASRAEEIGFGRTRGLFIGLTAYHAAGPGKSAGWVASGSRSRRPARTKSGWRVMLTPVATAAEQAASPSAVTGATAAHADVEDQGDHRRADRLPEQPRTALDRAGTLIHSPSHPGISAPRERRHGDAFLAVFLTGDRGFESVSFRQRVRNEPLPMLMGHQHRNGHVLEEITTN